MRVSAERYDKSDGNAWVREKGTGAFCFHRAEGVYTSLLTPRFPDPPSSCHDPTQLSCLAQYFPRHDHPATLTPAWDGYFSLEKSNPQSATSTNRWEPHINRWGLDPNDEATSPNVGTQST